MASLTVTYGGNTIISETQSGAHRLKTGGKYLTDDITLTADAIDSLTVSYGSQAVLNGASGSGMWKLKTAGKYASSDIGVEAAIGLSTAYLTFSAPADFTIGIASGSAKGWDGLLQFSHNRITWATWTGMTIASSSGKLYMRGVGNTVINTNLSISGSNVSCTGNIETLLDYATVDNGQHPTMGAYCFYCLFWNCTALVSAPEFPSTSLSEHCYDSALSNTRITSAPDLPSTTLAAYCYYCMFSDTNILEGPQLNATTMAEHCYHSMFQNCTLMTSAHVRVVTAASYCCTQMFDGCRSLTSFKTQSSVNVTQLYDHCYESMFQGCASLTSILRLNSVSISAPYACNMMYAECTSLDLITSPTVLNYIDSGCFRRMFYGCSSIMVSAANTGSYSYSFKFPKISASPTVVSGGLDDMFTGTGGTFTGTPVPGTTYYTTRYVN